MAEITLKSQIRKERGKGAARHLRARGKVPGIVYGKEGDLHRAITDSTKAIDLKTDFVEAYHNRGTAYGQMFDLDRARKDFQKAIELDPGGPIGAGARSALKRLKEKRGD